MNIREEVEPEEAMTKKLFDLKVPITEEEILKGLQELSDAYVKQNAYGGMSYGQTSDNWRMQAVLKGAIEIINEQSLCSSVGQSSCQQVVRSNRTLGSKK